MDGVYEETRWWRALPGGVVACELCPRRCRIRPGKAGSCTLRRNEGGSLVDLSYGHPSGLSADPVEKKPLHHFLPGSRILSFGTAGCNLGCRFCQNWHMSQADASRQRGPFMAPQQVVDLAQQAGCSSIAFTYNDPVIFAEYAIDVAQAASEAGIRCAAVTAGYIEPEPRAAFFAEMAAANIDLKGMSEDFYRSWCRGHLQPVLDTIEWVVRETECWVELTNLVVPGLNDSDEDLSALVDWVAESLGPDVPVHFSAFHPAFQVQDRPRTPHGTLQRARELAIAAGLHYVYLGNVRDPDAQNTRCPGCGALLVGRSWYDVGPVRLQDNHCPDCGGAVAGVWR